MAQGQYRGLETPTPACGFLSRSVSLMAAVPEVALKAPGAGVSRLTSRTGVSSEAGEYATEVSFRYSARVSSLVQLMRPLASRTQSVRETTA